MDALMKVMPAAATKVRQLIAQEGNPELKLRVYITGGGCKGLQYGFTFDEKVKGTDSIIEEANIGIVVDAVSIMYLKGAEIDYIEGLKGAHFTIKNPQVKSTCSCGSSFSLDDSAI